VASFFGTQCSNDDKCRQDDCTDVVSILHCGVETDYAYSCDENLPHLGGVNVSVNNKSSNCSFNLRVIGGHLCCCAFGQ